MDKFCTCIGRKMRFCQDANFSQLHLSIQSNPIKLTDSYLYGYQQTSYKVCVEKAKAYNSQNDIEGKGHSWRTDAVNLKNYCKATVIKIAWY